MVYTDQEKATIVRMKAQNTSNKLIGGALNKSENAIQKFWSKYRLLEDLPPKPLIRKRLTNGPVGLEIKKIVRDNPTVPVRVIEKQLKEKFEGIRPTPKKSGIHNFLMENGLVMVKLLKKPLVSKRNKQRRIDFAREHLENIDPLIYETIWSDETSIRKSPKGHELQYRVHGSIKREDLPYNHQFQMGGFSVMFWGCFSAWGLGPLVALEGNQNQNTYLALLEEHLLPEIQAARDIHGIDMTFMQDNAPCHKTKKVMDFFETNGVTTLDWPAQSPDLNPIENLWAVIKRRRLRKYGIPHTKQELIEQIFETWEDLDENLLEVLSSSMLSRLNECLRLGGRPTKY